MMSECNCSESDHHGLIDSLRSQLAARDRELAEACKLLRSASVHLTEELHAWLIGKTDDFLASHTPTNKESPDV